MEGTLKDKPIGSGEPSKGTIRRGRPNASAESVPSSKKKLMNPRCIEKDKKTGKKKALNKKKTETKGISSRPS